MKYLAVLGRQPEISIAELSALFSNVKKINNSLAIFTTNETIEMSYRRASGAWQGEDERRSPMADHPLGRGRSKGPMGRADAAQDKTISIAPKIDRLGGTIKLAIKLDKKPLEYLQSLPDGKITLGISDYSKNASARSTKTEALKLKQILVRHGRSVRVVESKAATLSTATSLHNGLSGKNDHKCELIKVNNDWYKVIGVQDIDAYTRRDQARPARDAKVGMLPPKLAQILINLCGPLKAGSRILDPFCGTGVVLQEALLMGYTAYGTDLSERMIEYTKKNLEWLLADNSKNCTFATVRDNGSGMSDEPHNDGREEASRKSIFLLSVADATSFKWSGNIDAVACEGYLGAPMSQIPPEIKLKDQKHECEAIILGFLKNLSDQIKPDTPVVIAAPAWLRSDGTYSRLNIVDEIENMGYNVKDISREGLLYHRDDQIVARDIIILRKK